MQQTVKDRITAFIRHLDVPVYKFESSVGLSNGYLKNLRRSPGADKLQRILDAYPELSRDWLLTGEGDMLNVSDGVSGDVINYTDGIPYYDYEFSAGFDSLADDSASERPVCLINAPWLSRATLCCRAYGDSMRPEINSGDILALRRVEDFRFIPYGEVYGIITTEGLHTVKRVRRSRLGDDYLLLVPTNPDYDPQDIPISTIMHLYRVIGTIKLF